VRSAIATAVKDDAIESVVIVKKLTSEETLVTYRAMSPSSP
jgi:hypothetical protein